MFFNLIYQIGFASQNSGLWTSKQLIPGETNQVRSGY